MAKKTTTTKEFETFTKIDMKAINSTIKVRDLVDGYSDKSLEDEGGITSMKGRLNIRPKYQRAYIADTKHGWRENLINSILCGYPINRIYIGVDTKYADKTFTEWALEMLDGQQRSKTICDYVIGKFSITIGGYRKEFDNLSKAEQESILNYELDVTYCIGDESARIAWFKRINQPNSILVPQELRNATYVGEWLECAKKFFSATSSQARKQINNKEDKYYANNYSSGRSIERSEYLELAIDWVAYDKYADLRSDKNQDERICKYMSKHQNDTNADEIISHYKAVIDWIHDVFFHDGLPKSSKSWQSVRSQDWGRMYSQYKDKELTEEEKLYISKRTKYFISLGSSIYQKSDGFYEWVLRGEKDDEINRFLHLRNFTDEDKSARYNAQGGIDPIDGQHYEMEDMEAHHLISWKNGGDSKYDNLVWLSKKNHRAFHNGDLNITADELRKKRDELCKK